VAVVEEEADAEVVGSAAMDLEAAAAEEEVEDSAEDSAAAGSVAD